MVGSDWHFGLLDRLVDAQHRASRRVPHLVHEDEATDLGVVRTRTPQRAWRLDPRWVERFVRKLCRLFCVIYPLCTYFFVFCRLSLAGLLPLARMVEAIEEDDSLVDDDGAV